MENILNDSNQNQPNQDDSQDVYEKIQNHEISQENIDLAVQLYKKFVAQKMLENVKGQEDSQKEQMIGFQLNQSHVSQQAETPQFRTQINLFNLSELQLNEQVQNHQSSNIIEAANLNIEVPANQIQEITSSSSKRIKFFPLYEIDHSKQFFQACHDLSSLLKKYKDFVKYYCSGEISSLSYKEGVQLNSEFSLNGKGLKQLAKAVFRNVFRRMEQYILNLCKKNIVSISEEDILLLSQIILNQTNLGQNYIEILKKFMKLSFDIPAMITEQEVLRLYSFMMRYLNEKSTLDICQFKFNSNNLNHFVWNYENQRKFCQAYSAMKSLKLVAETMNKESIQPKVTFLDLRYKLEQIIRQTIKIVETQYKKYQKDQYRIPLTSLDIKAIIRDIKALPLRLVLFRTNMKKYVFLQDIKKIISAIDSYLKNNNIQRESKKIVLPSQNKKLTTSDDSSSNNQDQQPSSSEESEEYLFSNKNNKKTFNSVENRPRPKYYQQTLFSVYQKNSQSLKGQRKIIPSISSNSIKKGSSQYEKLTPNFKSHIRQK